MSCVSNKSTDKKVKKGKTLPKKKQPEIPVTEDSIEAKELELEQVHTEDKSYSQTTDSNHGQIKVLQKENCERNGEEIIIENEGRDVNEKECDTNPVMVEPFNGVVETERENAMNGVGQLEDSSIESNQGEKKGTENIDNGSAREDGESIHNDQKRDNINSHVEHIGETERTVEFTVQDEDDDSGFVVIDIPGETNDDVSDSGSVRIAESDNVTKPETVDDVRQMDPFTELVDIHAINQILKGSSHSSESDMDVTAELFLQYLTRDQKKHLKLTIRKAGWSLTDDIRTILWQKLCQHLYKADTDDVLNEYQETLFPDDSGGYARVPSFVDVHHMPHYCLNKEGVQSVRQIMGVLEVTNPDIVYSPMLYPVVCLFLHYMDTTQCYNCIYALLRNPAFISQTKVCYEASKLVMRDLAKRHAVNSGGYARVPSFVDVHHMPHYCLNKEGVQSVRQIMGVLEVTNPDIVYSPMLYPVVCLFLHYMDTTQCYNCIYALLRNPAFISQTKVCYEASKLVMRDLAKRHAKSAYIFLVRNCTNVDAVFDCWVWWVLKDLPFQFLVRVIDCYLLEGVKVLYRVALSILIHFAKSHGKKSSVPKSENSGNSGNSAIISALRQFCQEMPVSIDKVLKTGFSIRGLRRKDIQKLQVKHEMYINSQRHLVNNGDSTNQMPMSRSFSGPIVLQNLSSNTLTADMLLAVWTWLPTRYAVCQPELLYTSEEHGTSLVTLYQRVENHQPTIIVIKTTTDEIFGAFCSTYWKERRSKSSNLSYFGTGETFIFTLWPEKKKYQWVGLSGEKIPSTANMFQAGDRSILTIGGGHGEAIYLDENLIHCRTEKCDTFNNEPLSQNEDFMCKVVEVYGVQ